LPVQVFGGKVVSDRQKCLSHSTDCPATGIGCGRYLEPARILSVPVHGRFGYTLGTVWKYRRAFGHGLISMGVLMRNYHRIWLAGLLFASISAFAQNSSGGPQAPGNADVPVLKGGAGSCTADFVVTDSSGKGVYDAKIAIQIKYGFMGLRKLDLTIGTNFEGKARVEGLPEQFKGSAEFKVSHGDRSKTVPYDPQANCHPRHEVILGEK
jgi:hypothetical protein